MVSLCFVSCPKYYFSLVLIIHLHFAYIIMIKGEWLKDAVVPQKSTRDAPLEISIIKWV